MNKFFIFLLVLSLMFCLTQVELVNGQSFHNEPNVNIKRLEIKDTTYGISNNIQVNVRKVTLEEAIQILSNKKNIPLYEARNIILDNSNYKTNSDLEFIYECTVRYDFGLGYEIEAGCLAKTDHLYSQGLTVWSEVIDEWTIAVGSGFYTWEEAYLHHEIKDDELKLYARGTVTVPVDISISGGLELRSKLLDAGFSIGGNIGSIYYLRKIDSWGGEFIAPQYV